MGSNKTDFHKVAARAFDKVRGMNDGQCRDIELALFEAASKQLGAPDAADEVLEGLSEAPHRGFRYHTLATVRALVANAAAAGDAPGALWETLDAYLSGDVHAAAGRLKASDMDRYRPSPGVH